MTIYETKCILKFATRFLKELENSVGPIAPVPKKPELTAREKQLAKLKTKYGKLVPRGTYIR